MDNNNQILCPKCNSNQLTATKKGFSGKKAVVGGLLVGGIGLLAGTLGSNNIKITCLACGHEFKPGEGNDQQKMEALRKEREAQKNEFDRIEREYQERKELLSSHSRLEEALFKILKEGTVRGAELHYKKIKKVSDEEAKKYITQFIADNNLSEKVNTGCFIATACYGDYDAREVVVLRKYRDRVLKKYTLGRAFIKLYYLLSPPIARNIEKSEKLKRTMRSILAPIVKKLDQ